MAPHQAGRPLCHRHDRPDARARPQWSGASAGRGPGPVQEGPQELARRSGRVLAWAGRGGGDGAVSPVSRALLARSSHRPGRSWIPFMSWPWRPASSTSAAAGSSERSQGGGAGRVTGSTGPSAPYAPGPACSPMPRPSAWRTSSLMIATLRSRPPGASTSASSRPTAPRTRVWEST